MEEEVKLIKVKVPLDRKNLNAGYKIVEVSEELAGIQFSKEKRSTHWEHVEIATEEDLKSLDKKGVLSFSSEQAKKEIQEAKETAEFLKMENEEMKKKISELEAKKEDPKTPLTVK